MHQRRWQHQSGAAPVRVVPAILSCNADCDASAAYGEFIRCNHLGEWGRQAGPCKRDGSHMRNSDSAFATNGHIRA